MRIAVAGAGVAGLAVAAFLGRAGLEVVVYDKLPEPAPVGSGLIIQPTGQAVLSELGLLDALRLRGARIDRLYGRTNAAGRIVLDVRYTPLGPDVHGIAVHRATLFDLLLGKAIEAGVAFERGREIEAVDVSAEGSALSFADGRRSPRFDLVIDAMGVRSPLIARSSSFLDYGAIWANLPWPANGSFTDNVLEQRYEKASRMAGVLPIGALPGDDAPMTAFFWSLRQDAFGAWRQRGLPAWKSDALRFWPETAPFIDAIEDESQLVFARYAHHTLSDPVERGLVHIGDSWHAASPQLGQGANMAMLDAAALAQAIERSGDVAQALRAFVSMRRFHVRLYQLASWLFTPVYQSDSSLLPWLRDVVAAPLSRMPPAPYLLASMVAGTLGRPEPRLHGRESAPESGAPA